MNQALLRPLFDHEPPSEIHFAWWPIESITGIKHATVVPSDYKALGLILRWHTMLWPALRGSVLRLPP